MGWQAIPNGKRTRKTQANAFFRDPGWSGVTRACPVTRDPGHIDAVTRGCLANTTCVTFAHAMDDFGHCNASPRGGARYRVGGCDRPVTLTWGCRRRCRRYESSIRRRAVRARGSDYGTVPFVRFQSCRLDCRTTSVRAVKS